MFSDITTPEKQLKAKRDYQKYLREELNAAISIYNQLNESDRAKALKTVNKINRIRNRIYGKAMELGYVKRCIDSIVVCKGECCKWHFPKNTNYLDLFITVCSISPAKQIALKNQIVLNSKKYQCPVLRKNGCLLSFDSRPLACSSAYPCFSGNVYQEFLEKQKKEINAQYALLKKIFEPYLSASR